MEEASLSPSWYWWVGIFCVVPLSRPGRHQVLMRARLCGMQKNKSGKRISSLVLSRMRGGRSTNFAGKAPGCCMLMCIDARCLDMALQGGDVVRKHGENFELANHDCAVVAARARMMVFRSRSSFFILHCRYHSINGFTGTPHFGKIYCS